jgi:hypothetical protein
MGSALDNMENNNDSANQNTFDVFDNRLVTPTDGYDMENEGQQGITLNNGL